jgi:Zn-dependent protease/CBS domain-containing protein
MGDFRLGSISGFEIRIDYSWFILFFLLLWSFGAGAFPAGFPGHSPPVYLAMGLAATLLFFASLLAHEISHSLVARAKGIPVEGITLFIFGGMARTRMEAASPGDEFQIAGIGPVSSFLIALLFGAIWWLGLRLGWSTAVTGVAQYLILLNLILALFNLLPGFPLDGGRLFRATVWKATGDLTRATRWASMGGRWLGYALIALGLLQLFQGALGGLWLVLIGWFLRNAAATTYEQHLIRVVLEDVAVADAMTASPETVGPDLTLDELMESRFLRRRFHAFPVADGDRPLGLVTLRQVAEVPREEWRDRTVADVMTPLADVPVVRPEEDLTELLRKMGAAGAARALVVSRDRLVGLVTTTDIAGWLRHAREIQRSGRR